MWFPRSWFPGSWLASGSDRPKASRPAADRLDGRDEVVRPGDRPGVVGQRVPGTAVRPDHAVQHPGQPVLVGAESDEHGSVCGDRAERHVAAEDVAEALLV